MPDQVHLVVKHDPKASASYVANQFKGYTSRVLREEFPHLRSKLPTLWSSSYFAASATAPIASSRMSQARSISSGVTVTIAHWALKEGNRTQLILFMIFTIALGVLFLGLQAYEYIHAYSDLNLKLSTGAYGSTFFMLTGFHGFHVIIGTIMLPVILGRLIAGPVTP
jgi:cytochrome c oxidase subunit III